MSRELLFSVTKKDLKITTSADLLEEEIKRELERLSGARLSQPVVTYPPYIPFYESRICGGI